MQFVAKLKLQRHISSGHQATPNFQKRTEGEGKIPPRAATIRSLGNSGSNSGWVNCKPEGFGGLTQLHWMDSTCQPQSTVSGRTTMARSIGMTEQLFATHVDESRHCRHLKRDCGSSWCSSRSFHLAESESPISAQSVHDTSWPLSSNGRRQDNRKLLLPWNSFVRRLQKSRLWWCMAH